MPPRYTITNQITILVFVCWAEASSSKYILRTIAQNCTLGKPLYVVYKAYYFSSEINVCKSSFVRKHEHIRSHFAGYWVTGLLEMKLQNCPI